MKRVLVLLFCLILGGVSAQTISVKAVDGDIKIDGKLDDAMWATVKPSGDFWQNFPTDSLPAKYQTKVYMAFDDNNLYVGIRCEAAGNNFITPSLKRDYSAGGSDNVTLVIDSFDDYTNAFVFGLNPHGVRREALISNGGIDYGRSWSDSWDNKWRGDAFMGEDFWTCEFVIPFKTLRYKKGADKWNLNVYRFDSQSNEITTWVQIPRNQTLINLAFVGDMKFEQPLKKAGGGVALIPYVTSRMSQDFEAGEKASFGFNAGGDAKIALTSSLNLDLTVNPDFSQVEVDRQVTNLDRFEIFFPERRQFFLENADLFGGFGDSRINPFFSRRIGIAQDTTEEVNIENAILGGARLSGRINKNWRVGLLSMQTAQDKKNDLPSFNYTVLALQRRVFERSNIGLIFVNKQDFDTFESVETYNPFNRVLGLDYNLASTDGRWTGKAFLHKTFSPEEAELGEEEWAHGFKLRYNRRSFNLGYEHQYVGEDFNAEVGFVPRKDFYRINPEAGYAIYPDQGIFTEHRISADANFFWNPEIGKTDHSLELNYSANLRNTARLGLSLVNDYTYLTEDFDPTRSDAEPLPGGEGYAYTYMRASFNTDRRAVFSAGLNPTFGQFYNGSRYGVGLNLSYRFQPYGSISANVNYNYIKLPAPYATTSLFLIGPRIDVTFTKSIFLTTFVQYNSQIENININARFQWRFAPVSDFFIVYTDNYTSDNFSVKNRAIVAKLTYWFNL